MVSNKRSAPSESLSEQLAKRKRLSAELEDIDVGEAGKNKASQPNKIRFGSEELDEWSKLLKGESLDEPGDVFPNRRDLDTLSAVNEREDEGQNDEDDDDDEAPEALGAEDAKAQARARQAEAARTAQLERELARKQRQDRAAQLESQAKSSNTRRAKTQADQKATDTSKPSKSLRKADIPDLLPEHVLANAISKDREESPESESDTGPTANTRLPQKKRLTRFDHEPKDIQAGPVRVSVLKDRNKFLAPKVNKSSRNIKQNWLAGRRGKSQVLERHKPTRGFLVS